MGKPMAIIGAGNGGQAFAGYLSLHGRTVKIFDVVQSTVDKLQSWVALYWKAILM